MQVLTLVCTRSLVMVEVGSYLRIDYFEPNSKRNFGSLNIRNLQYDYRSYVKKEYQEFEGDHLLEQFLTQMNLKLID